MDHSDTTVLVLGIIFIILGFVFRYIIGKRRFDRRTYGGMQRFENYNKSLGVPILEKIFIFLSTIIILAGLFFIGVWYFNRN